MTRLQTLRPHHRIYLLALVIFIVGSISGTLIYLLSGADTGTADAQILGNPKTYYDQVERIGGRSAVFADQFNHWLGGLWHGERLGITLVVLATITTLILLWVARQVERDELYRTSRKIEE